MAMLAEPRRKQKIINLRAKNSEWSKDSNKFGQRMLEKMGWTSGKGLGAKENGIVEHVVARYKNDEKGLGFEDKNDQWTKHEDDFNSLLANLSNANDDSKVILHSGVSLEDKSKKSKTRIHYHKFTRGKDLSRYSEKDLANIFGKKSFKEEKQIETHKSQNDETTPTEQVFTEKGSMEDYFKNKMAAFKTKSKTKTINKNDVSNIGYSGFDESESCGFQGFIGTIENLSNSENEKSLNVIENHCEVIDSPNENNCKNNLKIKKKKKKKSKEEPQENECDRTVEDSVNTQITKMSKRKLEDKNDDNIKKHKLLKNKQQETEQMKDNDIDNTVQKVKKKKKKEKDTQCNT